MAGIQYSIGKNYFRRACLSGMHMEEGDALCTDTGVETHTAILPVIDSGMEDCAWGRLKLDEERDEDAVVYFYLIASNKRESFDALCDAGTPVDKKKQLVRAGGGLRVINRSDLLLYELSGRYLWIMVEVVGAYARLGGIRVQAPGDNFMATFPEVYREKNSFFHRYLSIFSSMYNDFQDKLDHREDLLDIAHAPQELLLLYARWLGLALNKDYFDVEVLRALVREAGELSRIKGTKGCMERLCKLLIGETPQIVERSHLQRYVRKEERERIDRLYGDSPFDVTLLLRRPIDEKQKKQLLMLLGQFKPVRSRLRIVCLTDSGVLDGHTYLDENAVSFVQSDGVLDDGRITDGTVVLQ